jgi:hypothetical protein
MKIAWPGPGKTPSDQLASSQLPPAGFVQLLVWPLTGTVRAAEKTTAAMIAARADPLRGRKILIWNKDRGRRTCLMDDAMFIQSGESSPKTTLAANGVKSAETTRM